jgi:peptidyl-prolyl cis-trans isomerase B (cyclophilin B)
MIFGGLATVAVCAVVGIGVFFATRPDDNGNANGSGTGTNTNNTQNTTSQNTGNSTSSDKNENSTTNNNTQVDSSVVTKPLIELDKSVDYYATIDIADYGTIKVKLNQEVAPVTVSNFVSLAQKGFYNGLTFHRIIEDFMMQGGAPDGDGTKGAGYNIFGEFTANGHENKLSHTRGALSMARAFANNTASSQFFICHKDSLHLDGQYAVFGYVTEGMDVVDAVCEKSKPTDDNGTIKPEEQPVITSVKITTVAK